MNGKEYLTEKDMDNYPIWSRNEKDDLIYPVFGPEEFPETGRLYIRTRFTTSNGMTFIGYIIGIQNIFSIAIFLNNEILHLNKNFPNRCVEMIERIALNIDTKIRPEEFSPLQYQTTMNLQNFNDISGEFDIFKERTNAERLPGIWVDK